MLQRCDTVSITLGGDDGGMGGWRGVGWRGMREGDMPNRQNHMGANHTWARAQVTKHGEKNRFEPS